jgi:putative FmdB family regulatory protein
MPIYEYQCQSCGHHFEIMQKISEAPLSECGECGGNLEKQWSQTSFQLKGSGWYVNDYGKSGGGAKSGKETAAPQTETAKTEEIKPAAKTETTTTTSTAD